MDNSRYVRYTNEQVEALEHLYSVCPKPSSSRRQQLIEECPILANIEPKQIKVWFQNRRCREKQRKESTRLAAVNVKLTSMNKLLLEENRRLTKHTSELAIENSFLRQQVAKLEVEKNLKQSSGDSEQGNERGRVWGGVLSDKLERAAGKHQCSIPAPAPVPVPVQVPVPVPVSVPVTLPGVAVAVGQGIEEDAASQPLHTHKNIFRGRSSPQQQKQHMFVGGPAARAAAAVSEPALDSVVTSLMGLSPSWERNKAPISSDPGISGVMTVAAEELLAEFLAKATGTAVDWVHLEGTMPCLELLGIISVSHTSRGVASRACGLVQLEPDKAKDLLKQRSTWLDSCRRCTVLGGFQTADGGNVEYVYSQMYSPTTLAAPRDFCTLRFTSKLADGSIVVCERSLSSVNGGARVPEVAPFVRGEMLPSGFLIRPSPDGAGSIVIIVDHLDLKAWLVPEVLRPYYESPASLAHSSTMEALRYLKRVGEALGEGSSSKHHQPSQWRPIAQRLCIGFNEAVNGFADDGWEPLVTDGSNDVSIVVRLTTPNPAVNPSSELPSNRASTDEGVICARASMLLQNVPPAQLIQFLRDNRPQWVDAHKTFLDPHNQLTMQLDSEPIGLSAPSQTLPPVPLGAGPNDEEVLELVRLEGGRLALESGRRVRQASSYLLQFSTGLTKHALGAPLTQLIFAPVDATGTLSETSPILPSGFSVIPLHHSEHEESGTASLPTLDLASSLDGERGQSSSSRTRSQEGTSSSSSTSAAAHRGILTLAFQFPFDGGNRDDVSAFAQRYARAILMAVQRIAVALGPTSVAPNDSLPTSEAYLLVRRLLSSYRLCVGTDLVRSEGSDVESLFKAFWSHPEAIICCLCKLPALSFGPHQRRESELEEKAELKFANEAGLEMLETRLQDLQSLSWSKTLDAHATTPTSAAFAQVIQQGFACLPAGINMSSSGRAARYERGLAWRVLDNDQTVVCIGVIYLRWSFLTIKL